MAFVNLNAVVRFVIEDLKYIRFLNSNDLITIRIRTPQIPGAQQIGRAGFSIFNANSRSLQINAR
jgi:hypothetical protein